LAGLTLSGNMLFGTTAYGGSTGDGIVFRVKTDGTGYAVLKNFTGSDGANPNGGLTLAGSTLYGTTESGGSSNNGTVFAMSTNGTGYTVLKNFTGSDGANPFAALTLSGNMLYGTTTYGGTAGAGTVFTIDTSGITHTVLKNFAPRGTDGANPLVGLTLFGGVLYGTTDSGGERRFGNDLHVEYQRIQLHGAEEL